MRQSGLDTATGFHLFTLRLTRRRQKYVSNKRAIGAPETASRRHGIAIHGRQLHAERFADSGVAQEEAIPSRYVAERAVGKPAFEGSRDESLEVSEIEQAGPIKFLACGGLKTKVPQDFSIRHPHAEMGFATTVADIRCNPGKRVFQPHRKTMRAGQLDAGDRYIVVLARPSDKGREELDIAIASPSTRSRCREETCVFDTGSSTD